MARVVYRDAAAREEVRVTPAGASGVAGAFLARDARGGLYVVETATRVVVAGPGFANYVAWRRLRDWPAVFRSPGYSGPAAADRAALSLAP